jgi:hypothetical protein
LQNEEKDLSLGSSRVNALLEHGVARGFSFGDAVFAHESGDCDLFGGTPTFLLPAEPFTMGAIRPRSPSPDDHALRQPASVLRAAGPGEFSGASRAEERFDARFEILSSRHRQPGSQRSATGTGRSLPTKFF